MAFNLKLISNVLSDSHRTTSGVDFSGRSLKLDTENDALPIVKAVNECPDLQYLTLTGNTLGVEAAKAIAKALVHHPELKIARFSDMFTGRMKTEIPPALSALGEGMIEAGARLSVLDLSDNAFGPIGVEGLARLLQSDVCSELQGSSKLRFADYYVYDQRACTAVYNNVAGSLNILPSMICAVSYDILSSGCIGDDGNALVCGGEFAGVLSLSDGCRSSSYPEIYTRVTEYTAWIRTIVPSSAPSLVNTGLIAMLVMSFVVQIVNLRS